MAVKAHSNRYNASKPAKQRRKVEGIDIEKTNYNENGRDHYQHKTECHQAQVFSQNDLPELDGRRVQELDRSAVELPADHRHCEQRYKQVELIQCLYEKTDSAVVDIESIGFYRLQCC